MSEKLKPCPFCGASGKENLNCLFLESFEATDVRFGNALLWIKLAITDENRHIPLREVRWFSVEESK